MNRILLDENVPYGLRKLLRGDVVHLTDLGWDGISNGRLVFAAEREGFEVLVTADRNLRHQQNLTGRKLALVVLDTNNWNTIKVAHHRLVTLIQSVQAGTVNEINLASGLEGQLVRSEEPEA